MLDRAQGTVEGSGWDNGRIAFAAVIVNYRSPGMTAAAARCAAEEGASEIVVVDHSADVGALPGATVLERPNRGFAAGVNAGFAATTEDVVVLLNPDTRPAPCALSRLVAHLREHPRAGVAAPRLLHGDGTPQPSAYRRDPGLGLLFVDLCLPVGWLAMRVPALDRYRLPPDAWAPGRAVAHVAGAALAVRRAAYDAAGPLDEGYFLYLEETEWQQRVRRAGWTIELVPDAVVEHLVRGGDDLAPSPHFLTSARRYLAQRGHRPRVVAATIRTALMLSSLAARAENLVVRDRATGGARAAAYDALWRR